MGYVSVEDAKSLSRINLLRRTRAKVKFLSCEPLIGPLTDLNLKKINWVIVGGESGRRPRPMKPEWVFEIHNKCIEENVPFFFKQWGGMTDKQKRQTKTNTPCLWLSPLERGI